MKRENGFSLIELMIVIVLVAIVTAISIPSFTSLIKKNRLAGQGNDFIAGLMLARSEAVKRNLNVIVCVSADGTSCTAGGNWEQGWIIFADTNANGAYDAGEELVIHRALSHASTLRSDGTFASKITYIPRGFVNPAAAGGFVLCPSDGDFNFGRAIMISATGRPRITDATSAGFNACDGS